MVNLQAASFLWIIRLFGATTFLQLRLPVHALMLTAVLCGCAHEESSAIEKRRSADGTWQAFSCLVETALGWEQAFSRAAQFLVSVGDPALVYDLLQLSDAGIQNHLKARRHEGSEEYSIKYGAAWEACVHRLGQLAQEGSEEALACLLRVLTEGRHDGLRTATLASAIVGVGRRAVPLLRAVTGRQASLAQMLIEDIQEGRQYF